MQKINLPENLLEKLRERIGCILAERLGGRAAASQVSYATKNDLQKSIDAAARETETNPSDEQKEAGNYRKGKFRLHGLEIAIENPRGSERRGKDKNGTPWSIAMQSHYGYIKKHISEADGDHVDVFIGQHPESQYVAVIDQVVGGKFDEHKVMIGYRNAAEAKAAYLASYTPSWKGFRSLTPMTMNQFKAWLEKGDTAKPAAEQPIHYAKHKSAPGQANLFDAGPTSKKPSSAKPDPNPGSPAEFDEDKHPRDRAGKFTKKVGQANLMLWGDDGEPSPAIQSQPRQLITHDISVDAREAAAHAFHKALHAAGKIADPPKHPAPANIAEMKKAAGFDDDQGLLLFRHGDTLRAHGSDAQRFAEINGGKDSAPASSLEQIGQSLKAKGHRLAIASKPEKPGEAKSPEQKPEPPKTPGQQAGAEFGNRVAAEIVAKPAPPKSPLAAFMPGKNSDYPKPDPVKPAAGAAPKPAPLAPPKPATPAAAPMTEAEQERAERAAMELARPAPPSAAKPAKDKTPRNNITSQEFGEMITKHRPMLANMARNYKIPEHDIDDAIQKAATQALAGLWSFDPSKGVQFSTWLGTVAQNAMKQEFRGAGTLKRGKGKKNISLNQEAGESSEAGKTATLADSVADYRENYDPEAEEQREVHREAIRNALPKLSDTQQKILEMFAKGLSSADISKLTGTTRQAVEGAMKRAAEKIRSMAGEKTMFDLPKKYQRQAAQQNFVALLMEAVRDKYLKAKAA